eukprot:TRINITY_DN24277_c0_g1_i1.p1 TRINITY_DN24277_c0_g1~~TRINITY_DN24277_c0_g1_i1.p1  ORF type:complete len:215 (+),score=54.88 TRINITY_DN24277_c0_g1_i1:3-647(+)
MMGTRIAFLLCLSLAAASVPSSFVSQSRVLTYSPPLPSVTTVELTNDLGPISVQVNYGGTAVGLVTMNITYFAIDDDTMDVLLRVAPSLVTFDDVQNVVSYTMPYVSSLATEVGVSCVSQPFSLKSPRPPCINQGYTSSPSSSGQPQRDDVAARIELTIPNVMRVCVNSYCANPHSNVAPQISPEAFSSVALSDDVVYDGVQGLLWHKYILPEL